MAEQVRFQGFCSSTRKPFLIIASLNEGTLTFQHAMKIGPGTPFGQGRPPLPSQPILRLDSSAFICPWCEMNARLSGKWAPAWFCSSCDTHHCMGTDKGVCHGACGTCAHDPATFVPVTRVAVKPADTRDF